MIEGRGHALLPSISLIQTIISFRLIEHDIGIIVNVVKGFHVWPDQQQGGNGKPATRSETETSGPY
jgi:hypothetical protein